MAHPGSITASRRKTEGPTSTPEDNHSAQETARVAVRFVESTNGPERRACEAELVFLGGPLDGMKLCGFAVWRGVEGDLYVTFPSRSFGTATDRKFFDYLRPVEAGAFGSRVVKEWILAEYALARAESAK